VLLNTDQGIKTNFKNIYMQLKYFLPVLFLFISNLALSQLPDYEVGCNKGQKVNNFKVGDTLYSHAWADSYGNTTPQPYCSPLLDSLCVTLKRDPGIKLIINSWMIASKKYYDDFVKKYHTNINIAELPFVRHRACMIRQYLLNKDVTNCMVCFGLGYKREGNPNEIEIQCKAVQIILTKADSVYTFDLAPNIPVVLNYIYFDINEYHILPKSFNELNLFANYMLDHPDITVEISGHTDNTGEYNKNRELSQKRADAVVAYLKYKGVTNKMISKGYGSTKPVASNETEEGRAKNRRVEVKIINDK
jgi:outer membrane protein OmpA-like peptidoglycan-associated protein